MIIAGIDEAGLGPALGPLCTAGAAFRLPAGSDAETPWTLWENILGREKKNKLPIVNDSKVVYTARGLAGLELPVLAFLRLLNRTGGSACAPDAHPSREALLAALGAQCPAADLPPWYQEKDWTLPTAANPAAVADLTAALRTAPEVRLLAFSARVRSAKALNREFAAGHNKSAAAWQSVAALIKEFANLEPQQEETLIVVDKQGGRNFYAALLAELFSIPFVNTIRESESLSEYRIGSCCLRFQTRADQSSFPTALASMLAKYLRERFMSDLNAWFVRQVPGLQPTAGYYGDAPRFYEQVKKVLQQHAVAVGDFWRQR